MFIGRKDLNNILKTTNLFVANLDKTLSLNKVLLKVKAMISSSNN